MFHKHVPTLTLAYETCQIFHDAIPHINISVPLRVMQEQQGLGRDALNTDQMDHTCMQAWLHKCIRAGKSEGAGQKDRNRGGVGCACCGAPNESVLVNTEHFTLHKKREGPNT